MGKFKEYADFLIKKIRSASMAMGDCSKELQDEIEEYLEKYFKEKNFDWEIGEIYRTRNNSEVKLLVDFRDRFSVRDHEKLIFSMLHNTKDDSTFSIWVYSDNGEHPIDEFSILDKPIRYLEDEII